MTFGRGLKTGAPNLAVVLAGLAIGSSWLSIVAAASTSLLQEYGLALFGIEVTLAVFSVNLSLVIFQLSPYRHLVQGMSIRHLSLAAAVLVVSLVPLSLTGSGESAVGRAALAFIPLSALGGFLVGMLAQREARPAAVIRRASSQRRRDLFLQRCEVFAKEEDRRRDEEMQRSPGAPPTHEVGHRNPLPPSPADPFDVCVNVIAHAVRSAEIVTVDQSLERLFELGVQLHGEAERRSNDLRGTLESHWARVLHRLRVVVSEDSSGEAGARFVLQIGQFLREQQERGAGVDEISMHTLAVGRSAAADLLEKERSHEAVSLLVDIRQVVSAELGRVVDFYEKYSLAGYPASVGALGSASIRLENLHVLYTCLDALAWVGCDAIRRGQDETARSCLQSLSQLGREARAKKLECFWSHCALTPTDHAEERLKWMAASLTQFPENGRDSLAASVGTAFSRLTGKEYEVSVETAEPPVVRVGPLSDSPYVESFSSDGHTRALDYSDPEMLKELRLH